MTGHDVHTMRGRDVPVRGVLFDYAGVLTVPVDVSFAAFERENGIEPGRTFDLLVDASRTSGGGVIGALEIGRIGVDEFDRELHRLLVGAGYALEGSGNLLEGLFAAMTPAGGLWGVVRQIRDHGHRTALVSNSWGTTRYPRQRLSRYFDALVISGEVGMRKPDPAIYRYACGAIGLAPDACAFVDDLERNVEAARTLGMVGVVHTGDAAATAEALSSFLEVALVPGEQ